MIGIIVIGILSIVLALRQYQNYIQDKNRINELEQRLNEYYIERGNRLNSNIKRIETKHNQLRNNGVHSL